ncbi:MAG: peptidase dimerization domain-containing protein, partial [Alphaproteobacteria bacterium]|nr:peptidase dimerization domain-containing protein [Alphaproteobacteria bacterium]
MLVHGGSASNIVPNQCEFRVDVRSLPWTAVDAVVAELEAYARDDL